MNASQMALELEQKVKQINHYVARGSYSNSLCEGQVGEHLDTIAQPYLDLIPLLEAIAAEIKEEVKEARERES